jgi:hypothetical protein
MAFILRLSKNNNIIHIKDYGHLLIGINTLIFIYRLKTKFLKGLS